MGKKHLKCTSEVLRAMLPASFPLSPILLNETKPFRAQAQGVKGFFKKKSNPPLLQSAMQEDWIKETPLQPKNEGKPAGRVTRHGVAQRYILNIFSFPSTPSGWDSGAPSQYRAQTPQWVRPNVRIRSSHQERCRDRAPQVFPQPFVFTIRCSTIWIF